MVKIILFFSCIFQSCLYATHYEYAHDEVDNLSTKKVSKLLITDEQVRKWDAIIEEYSAEKGLTVDETKHLLELFEIAQQDAIALSDGKATLDPLMLKILGLFFPDVKQKENYQSDPYSEALAQMIFPKVKKQFEEKTEIETEEK